MLDKADQTTSSHPTPETTRLSPLLSSKRRLWLRLLLVLLPIGAVGLALYGFLASPVRLVQPEYLGDMPSSRQIGQTFQVEYPGLRAIKVHLASKDDNLSDLRLHLAESNQAQNIRLAQPIATETSWLRFEFAPLDTSYKGRPLFFWLENGNSNSSFKLAWYDGNVYLAGQAYFDGTPQRGDLTFELEYQPDPAELLATYFNRQTAYGGLAWTGLTALILWMGLALFGCAMLALRGTIFSVENLRNMSAQRFRPIAIYFLVLAACGGVAFMFLTPPLQGLDEQGHLGRAVFVYQYQADPASYALIYQAEYTLENQARFVEYVPGYNYDYSPLNYVYNQGPLTEYYQPPVYYAIVGGVLRLGTWLTGSNSLLFQLYLARLTSLLLGLGGMAVVLGWAYYLRREAPWLLLSMPAVYALMPICLYTTGIASNDNAVNFFTLLLVFCLTVLYKAGYETRYNWAFWRRWWPVLLIGLGSAVLAYQSKHSVGMFVVGLAVGVLIYFYTWQNRRVRLGLLAGLAVLLVIVGVILAVKSPWQWQAMQLFLEGRFSQSRILISLQVLILTFDSFWGSAGWINFSDAAEGRLIVGFLGLSLLAIWGMLRATRSAIKARSAARKSAYPTEENYLARWLFHLALTLGLAALAHALFLILYRVLTSYRQEGRLIEFPEGRFFLLALLPMAALFLGGLRALPPVRLRQRIPLHFGLYCWFFGLFLYALMMLFGNFLPYYYNQN